MFEILEIDVKLLSERLKNKRDILLIDFNCIPQNVALPEMWLEFYATNWCNIATLLIIPQHKVNEINSGKHLH